MQYLRELFCHIFGHRACVVMADDQFYLGFTTMKRVCVNCHTTVETHSVRKNCQ